jgi:DNA-3-methyladenine glycosylase I
LKKINRCSWAGDDPDYCAYHDNEWGVPVHDDRKLFEMLILEGFQAGLSWLTILKRRAAFKKAFANWDWKKVAKFTRADVEQLMGDAGIIRNRLKIEGAIKNATLFEQVRNEFGSFDKYIWQFTDHKTVYPAKPLRSFEDFTATTPQSDAMSKDLKKRGFKFVGSTICYAFMQATGMADDHMEHCFKFSGKFKQV